MSRQQTINLLAQLQPPTKEPPQTKPSSSFNITQNTNTVSINNSSEIETSELISSFAYSKLPLKKPPDEAFGSLENPDEARRLLEHENHENLSPKNPKEESEQAKLLAMQKFPVIDGDKITFKNNAFIGIRKRNSMSFYGQPQLTQPYMEYLKKIQGAMIDQAVVLSPQ